MNWEIIQNHWRQGDPQPHPILTDFYQDLMKWLGYREAELLHNADTHRRWDRIEGEEICRAQAAEIATVYNKISELAEKGG